MIVIIIWKLGWNLYLVCPWHVGLNTLWIPDIKMSAIQMNPDFRHLVFGSSMYTKKFIYLSLFEKPFKAFYCFSLYSGDLNGKHMNSELIWKVNFYLVGIQMVTNWMVWTFPLVTMVKSSETKCHSIDQLFTIQIANY